MKQKGKRKTTTLRCLPDTLARLNKQRWERIKKVGTHIQLLDHVDDLSKLSVNLIK